MIITEHIEVWGWEHAIRGMRNPLNSWDKSDTTFGLCGDMTLGSNDLALMRRLFKGGTEHRKYLRQIFVSLDITAPLYWWKEFDTYKVGTVANSCSTMHKIAGKEFTYADFSVERVGDVPNCDPMYHEALDYLIMTLNEARHCYLDSKNKAYWWQMIQLLPSSYNQKRTVTMNYENVYTILRQRWNHKLDEWRTLCDTLSDLPYIKQIGELE